MYTYQASTLFTKDWSETERRARTGSATPSPQTPRGCHKAICNVSWELRIAPSPTHESESGRKGKARLYSPQPPKMPAHSSIHTTGPVFRERKKAYYWENGHETKGRWREARRKARDTKQKKRITEKGMEVRGSNLGIKGGKGAHKLQQEEVGQWAAEQERRASAIILIMKRNNTYNSLFLSTQNKKKTWKIKSWRVKHNTQRN